MINPPDLIRPYREGTDQVLPEDGSGPFGDMPFEDYESKPGKGPPIWRTYDVTLTANAETTLFCENDQPEYWIVNATNNVANAETSVYPAETMAGIPVRLGPTGHAVVPARSMFLTLRAIGSASSRLQIQAVRDYPFVAVSW